MVNNYTGNNFNLRPL